MDAEAFRADSRDRWEGAAKGWAARREAMQSSAFAVSERLVERAHLRPGHEVLEVAAGLGDTGLLAAEVVRPGGRVVITDGADAMVEAARAHAEASGADNVEVRQMEAEWLDVTTASFDAVVGRWGYMLLADPEAALREARRALRPGGRIAIAVWGPMSENPWIGVMQSELVARDLAPMPMPGTPGMFALAAPGAAQELLRSAGFADVVVEPLDFTWHAASLDAWWDHQRAVSVSTGQILDALTPAEHYALRDAIDAGYAPFVAPDGSVALPAQALIASADA
jgi:SAM-dependent methyltransferase